MQSLDVVPGFPVRTTWQEIKSVNCIQLKRSSKWDHENKCVACTCAAITAAQSIPQVKKHHRFSFTFRDELTRNQVHGVFQYSKKSVTEVLTKKKELFVWMEGFCLPSKVQSLSFTLTSCVQTLAGSSLNNGKTGCKDCPLPCIPLMWKVNCYKRVTCKLLVRAITLADKWALSWMGRKEREVPWSLLSQYNVLDLIEAGKTEQNTASDLKKVVVYF